MAPFLLSHLLFDQLRSAAPSRVILFYGGGRASFNLTNLMSDRDYDGWIAYNQTKNADVMIALELARRWEGTGIAVNCVFPGLVKTAIMQGVPRTCEGSWRSYLPLSELHRRGRPQRFGSRRHRSSRTFLESSLAASSEILAANSSFPPSLATEASEKN